MSTSAATILPETAPPADAAGWRAQRDTLVLSAAFEPVEQVSWRRAMTLWVAGRAEVIESYENRVVRGVSVVYPMPSVIRFLRGVRRFRTSVRFSRENIYARDRGVCQYCGRAVTRGAATYDHVVPRSAGGGTRWDNIVVACRACNQAKGNKTPEEAEMRLRQQPVRPRSLPDLWRSSFAWIDGMPESWERYLES